MISRRRLLSRGLTMAGGVSLVRWGLTAPDAVAQTSPADPHAGHGAPPPVAGSPSPVAAGGHDVRQRPVVTPNGRSLPFRRRDGVKEFHVVAQPVEREIAPGSVVHAWGYNGSTPGPTIEAVEGDRVRIYVTNELPEATTIHWHGLIVPSGMDGVAGVSQPPIRPGETWVYEFPLLQSGTFMYHPHADEMLQQAMGMMGFFIVHPRRPPRRIDRDYCIFLHSWYVEPGAATPDPTVMLDFNLFTFNGRVYPGTAPLLASLGDRVRLRFANLTMTNHPIHFHGHTLWETEGDGGPLAEGSWRPSATVDVPGGTTRVVEFVADNPGDWALHCHKNHHAMNAMGHGLTPLLGVDVRGVEEEFSRLLGGVRLHGTTGMGDHDGHGNGHPEGHGSGHEPAAAGVDNTVPMMAGVGPHGPIGMGGMFTLMKIREGLRGDEDPGWYAAPSGTTAWRHEGDADLPPV